MLTLLGTLFGGIFRLMPEVFSYFDKKNERAHELAMLNAQIEADKLRGQIALEQITTQGNINMNLAEMQGIIEATKAQATLTGVKWVDAMSQLMRPLLTFWWCIVLYSTALFCEGFILYSKGGDFIAAFLGIWGQDEKAIVASIISFWFVDRALRKMK